MVERKQPWDAADMAADEPKAKATRKTNDVGPTGQTVAANIARLRTARGLSTYRLSELLAGLDRGIAPSAISRIESGARKVDVDDLIAFAVALRVSPTALLLPPTVEGHVELTAQGVTPADDAWKWLLGEAPLPDDLPPGDDGEVWNDFQSNSRPPGRRNFRGTLSGEIRLSPAFAEAARQLSASEAAGPQPDADPPPHPV